MKSSTFSLWTVRDGGGGGGGGGGGVRGAGGKVVMKLRDVLT